MLALVKDWLEKRHRRPWLIIIDSADDSGFFLRPKETAGDNQNDEQLLSHIPTCSHGSLLVTSRFKGAVQDLVGLEGKVIQVEAMDDQESNQFVGKVLANDKLLDNTELTDIKTLADKLERLPLALAQALAYIKKNSITVKAYVQLLDGTEKNDEDIPQKLLTHETDKLEEVLKRELGESLTKQLVKTIMSGYLKLKKVISIKFKGRLSRNQGYQEKKARSDETEPTRAALELRENLGVLQGFALISTSRDGHSVTIHRLVQIVMRRWLIQTEALYQWGRKASLIVLDLFIPQNPTAYLQVSKEVMRHVDAVIKISENESRMNNKVDIRLRARLFSNKAMFLEAQKRLADQEIALRQAILLLEAIGEHHSRRLIEYTGALGRSYENQRRHLDAEELYLSALKLSKGRKGSEDPLTLRVSAHLACVQSHISQNWDAEKLLSEIIEQQTRILGAEDFDTLGSKFILGVYYCRKKRTEEAKKVFMEVVETSKRLSWRGGLFTLTPLRWLADIYYEQSRYEDAASLFGQLVEQWAKLFGHDHDDCLQNKERLAWSWKRMGRDEDAHAMLTEVLISREHTQGVNPSTEQMRELLQRCGGFPHPEQRTAGNLQY
ncbi:MAG: hypothetical protein Q9165_005954 [Trypethelium subeluteriae]